MNVGYRPGEWVQIQALYFVFHCQTGKGCHVKILKVLLD